MNSTGDAISLIGQCLYDGNETHPGIVTQFRREQSDGKTFDPTKNTSSPRSAVLDGIKIDPKPYEEALKAIKGDDFKSLCARGNLLLLADRATEAKQVFEHAYELADDGQVGAASENIARAIKAEDGTIGRANAWVLSIRPKAKPAPGITPRP
jgi:hypothetical protein